MTTLGTHKGSYVLPWIDITHPTYGASTGASAATNTAALAAAITDAKNASGGTVYIPVGVFSIVAGDSGLITATTNTENVRLVGAGSQNGPYGPTPTKGTVLKTTSGSGAILSWAGTGVDSLRGISIEGISFNGNSVASTGLSLDTLFLATFKDVNIWNVTSVGLNLTSNGVSDVGFHGCRFENLSISVAAAASAKGLVLNGHTPGAGNGDVSGVVFQNTFVYTQNGTGIELGYADGNRFYATLVNRSGTAIGLDLLASNTSGLAAYENIFYNLDAYSVTARGTTSGTYPSRNNVIFFSTDNSPDLTPTVETGAILHWSTTSGHKLPEYRTSATVEDDFISGNTTSGSIGALGWSTAGGTLSQTAAVVSHPGIVTLDTTSSSGTFARLFLGVNGVGIVKQEEANDITFYIRLNTNDSDTQIRLGLMNVFDTDPAEGFYFEKLYADTSWFGNARHSSASTRTAALASVSTGWVTLRYRRTWPDCFFSVNGGTEVTLTSSTVTGALSPGVQIKNQSAASKTVDIDYYHNLIRGLARA